MKDNERANALGNLRLAVTAFRDSPTPREECPQRPEDLRLSMRCGYI
jgi:hypothetical protein